MEAENDDEDDGDEQDDNDKEPEIKSPPAKRAKLSESTKDRRSIQELTTPVKRKRGRPKKTPTLDKVRLCKKWLMKEN